MARAWLKAILPCLFSLALVFLLVGCGKKDDSPSASSVSISEDSTSLSATSLAASSSESSSLPAVNAPPAVPVLEKLAIGTFSSLDGGEGYYPDERAPQFQLMENNAATFRVNTGSELGTATGKVSFSGSTLTFFVDGLDLEGAFWGDNIQQLTFNVLDENRLEYTGAPFGLTQRGKVFMREGTPGTAALVQGSGPAAPAVTIPISDPAPPSSPASASAPAQSHPPDGTADSASGTRPAQDASTPASAGVNASSSHTLVIAVEKNGIPTWGVIAIAVASAIVGGVGAVFLFLFLKKRKDTQEERAAQAVIRKEEKAVQAEQKKEAQQEKKDEATQRKEEGKAKKEEKMAVKAEKAANKAAEAKEKKAREASKKAAKAAQDAEKAAEKAAAAAEKAQGKATGQTPKSEKGGKSDDN